MKKYILILCLFTANASCKKAQIVETRTIGDKVQWADSSQMHPKNDALKKLLEKYKAKGLPGISLLVRDNSGTWVGAAGKADIENNIDFVAGTVSKVASITKLFMGVLTFKLMEDSANTGIGYLSLNEPIKKWLPPGIISKLPNGSLITLGQCLKHETGIPDIIEQDAFYLAVLNDPNKKWEAEELLSFIYNKNPIFYPSDTAIYSNTNFIIVSMILEAATSKKHSDLLKQYIFQPLWLTNTYYQPHDILPNSVAQGYYDLYNNNTIVSDFGYGHKGRDVGYTANLFYFPAKNIMHIFFINYGTDSKSNLRQVFYDFQEELLSLTLQ
jgi:D-alanyl-D-alanine carboxypeptidase